MEEEQEVTDVLDNFRVVLESLGITDEDLATDPYTDGRRVSDFFWVGGDRSR